MIQIMTCDMNIEIGKENCMSWKEIANENWSAKGNCFEFRRWNFLLTFLKHRLFFVMDIEFGDRVEFWLMKIVFLEIWIYKILLLNNFFSQKSISKVVSINLMWIFFHQFFQTNFSWLIFVQSEFSSKNKIKYSMLLYSIIHINVYFFSYFSSLSWISLIFLFRANRAHFDVYLCVLQLQIDIFYMLCIPSNQKKNT